MITCLLVIMIASIPSSVLCMEPDLCVKILATHLLPNRYAVETQSASSAMRMQETVSNSSPVTQFYYAVDQGNCATIKQLLEQGFDIKADNNSLSALSVACSKGHLDVVKLLIDAGADCKDIGFIHLLYHEWNKHLHDPHYQDSHYDAQVACAFTDILRFLYEKKVVVPTPNRRLETTFLCDFVRYNYAFCPKMAEYLLLLGADVNAKNKEGETALIIAHKVTVDHNIKSISPLSSLSNIPNFDFTFYVHQRPCSLEDVIKWAEIQRMYDNSAAAEDEA